MLEPPTYLLLCNMFQCLTFDFVVLSNLYSTLFLLYIFIFGTQMSRGLVAHLNLLKLHSSFCSFFGFPLVCTLRWDQKEAHTERYNYNSDLKYLQVY